MKEVLEVKFRRSTRWTTWRWSTWCPSISRRSLTRSTAPIGTAWSARTSAPLLATRLRIISSSMRDSSPFSSIKSDDPSPSHIWILCIDRSNIHFNNWLTSEGGLYLIVAFFVGESTDCRGAYAKEGLSDCWLDHWLFCFEGVFVGSWLAVLVNHIISNFHTFFRGLISNSKLFHIHFFLFGLLNDSFFTLLLQLSF